MFNIPIDDITIQDIEQFLQSGARENTVFELKAQFPNKLEKTISSMANTYGGMILIGVEETATGQGVLPIEGIPLTPGLRERVVQIGLDAIYPPLIPEVRVVEFMSDPALAEPDRAVVVIRVHESEEGHAIEQRTAVYVRADNVSDRMRKATVEEIEWFLNKRQKSVAEKSRIIQQAQQHSQQFLMRLRERHQRSTSEPKGRFAIWTVPAFPRLPIATPKELYHETRIHVRSSYLSYGSFPNGTPHPITEGVYWGDESSTYRYTEVNRQGLIYTEYEFWWDDQAASVFYPSAAAALLRSAGEFGRNLYRQLGHFGFFDIGMRLAGIRDRHIGDNRVIIFPPKIMDDTLELIATANAAQPEEELHTTLKELLRETYWAFGRDAPNDQLETDFKGFR